MHSPFQFSGLAPICDYWQTGKAEHSVEICYCISIKAFTIDLCKSFFGETVLVPGIDLLALFSHAKDLLQNQGPVVQN